MHYTDSTITWQAHSVIKVEQSCIDSGVFPNGKKMTASDIQDAKQQIEICKAILRQYGIAIENKSFIQLKLF